MIAGGHQLLDRALHPDAGAVDEHRTALRDTVDRPANRSPVFAASVRAASSCASPSTLMPSDGAGP